MNNSPEPLKYAEGDPLNTIIEYLEKHNYDTLASQVIDAFAAGAHGVEQMNMIAKLYLDVRNLPKAEEWALRVLGMTTNLAERYNARANLAKAYNSSNANVQQYQRAREIAIPVAAEQDSHTGRSRHRSGARVFIVSFEPKR